MERGHQSYEVPSFNTIPWESSLLSRSKWNKSKLMAFSPLFETRNPCIRPSANRRIYPAVPLQTFPGRARSRIVEIYPRMRKSREGSTVYDGVVTTGSPTFHSFHSVVYSRLLEEINSRYREIKIDFVRSRAAKNWDLEFRSGETWRISSRDQEKIEKIEANSRGNFYF